MIEVRSLDTTVGNVTNIDGVNFVGAGSTVGHILREQREQRAAKKIVVQGSAGVNFLELDRTTVSAVNINLTNWQFHHLLRQRSGHHQPGLFPRYRPE